MSVSCRLLSKKFDALCLRGGLVNHLVALKTEPDYAWLKAAHAQALQQKLLNLQEAQQL